jgi:hypothetical protein
VPKVSELIADEAPLTIPFDGGDVHIQFRPRVVTAAWQKRIGDAEQAGSDYEAMLYGPLKEAVISWDLERNDGSTYELTSEAMAEIPKHILNQTLVAIMRTARPNYQRLLGVPTAGSSAP